MLMKLLKVVVSALKFYRKKLIRKLTIYQKIKTQILKNLYNFFKAKFSFIFKVTKLKEK
jgi:hypothetical protein